MTRSTLEVDLGAVRANVRRLIGVAGGSEVWAVVKADGYGHGAVECAGAALTAGTAIMAGDLLLPLGRLFA